MTTYSYEGIYDRYDTLHPDGGSLNYVDENGVTKRKRLCGEGLVFHLQSVPTNIIDSNLRNLNTVNYGR
jgi:hypothetical protein